MNDYEDTRLICPLCGGRKCLPSLHCKKCSGELRRTKIRKEIICQICGTIFPGYEGRKFCSLDCAYKGRDLISYWTNDKRKKQSEFKKRWHEENKEYWLKRTQQRWDDAESDGWKEKHRKSVIESWKDDEERKKEQSRMEREDNRFLRFKRNKPEEFLELCELRSAIQLKKMSNIKFKNQVVRNSMLGAQRKPNKLEQRFDNFLQKHFPGEYKYTGDGSFILAGKCPDFTNINSKKKIIEIFGDYWHQADDPEERKEIFGEYGFDTLILWERCINNIQEDVLKGFTQEFTYK